MKLPHSRPRFGDQCQTTRGSSDLSRPSQNKDKAQSSRVQEDQESADSQLKAEVKKIKQKIEPVYLFIQNDLKLNIVQQPSDSSWNSIGSKGFQQLKSEATTNTSVDQFEEQIQEVRNSSEQCWNKIQSQFEECNYNADGRPAEFQQANNSQNKLEDAILKDTTKEKLCYRKSTSELISNFLIKNFDYILQLITDWQTFFKQQNELIAKKDITIQKTYQLFEKELKRQVQTLRQGQKKTIGEIEYGFKIIQRQNLKRKVQKIQETIRIGKNRPSRDAITLRSVSYSGNDSKQGNKQLFQEEFIKNINISYRNTGIVDEKREILGQKSIGNQISSQDISIQSEFSGTNQRDELENEKNPDNLSDLIDSTKSMVSLIKKSEMDQHISVISSQTQSFQSLKQGYQILKSQAYQQYNLSFNRLERIKEELQLKISQIQQKLTEYEKILPQDHLLEWIKQKNHFKCKSSVKSQIKSRGKVCCQNLYQMRSGDKRVSKEAEMQIQRQADKQNQLRHKMSISNRPQKYAADEEPPYKQRRLNLGVIKGSNGTMTAVRDGQQKQTTGQRQHKQEHRPQ